MYEFFKTLDRRWIFLLMLIAVGLPILRGWQFPERPSPMVQSVFDAIESLPEGSQVWMAYDYDPGSQGELHPMALAFTRHCALKKLKMYYMTLWPQGPPMIQKNVDVLRNEFPDLQYGVDYVNLGYRPGYEGPIKLAVTDLRKTIAADVDGKSLNDLPMTKGLKNIQNVDLIINVSAGYPGTKEWVLYAATPYNISSVAGCTGVQAPYLYPYVPQQLNGLLGAIKGAAEYEFLLLEAYPQLRENPEAQEALRRMGPQLLAHLVLIALIVIGNVIYFVGRRRGDV
ncbi:MAG: hypothetical protein KDA86_22700 [Planctomycetaceae bacterium]|nr:hypothetical protein [Planctomycetaceae bacterium]